MKISRIRSALSFLENTPFHPQWLIYRYRQTDFAEIGLLADGRVLDVGCGKMQVRDHIKASAEYIGLDNYFTATQWYSTRPDVYGSAGNLPFSDNAFDTVLLLDVLEHLPRPVTALKDIRRILRPGGRCIIKVPFMYPIHDSPLDFQRWTVFGLEQLCGHCGLTVEENRGIGSGIETAGLLTVIALTNSAIKSLQYKRPGMVLLLILPVLVPLINILVFIIQKLVPDDDFMHMGYLLSVKRSCH